MALDSGNVAVAVTGAVSIGTNVAAAPTDADTALGTGWTDLGYCSEAGIVAALTRSTSKIKAWQNAAVLREVVTESSATWAVTFVESKKDVIELYFASTVDADGKVLVTPAITSGRHPFVIDVVDGDDLIRTYIPEGELAEAVGDQTYASGEAVGYSVTITGYPAVALSGATFAKWFSALAA